MHDHEIVGVFDAIKQLMLPPEKPKRKMGFLAWDEKNVQSFDKLRTSSGQVFQCPMIVWFPPDFFGKIDQIPMANNSSYFQKTQIERLKIQKVKSLILRG